MLAAKWGGEEHETEEYKNFTITRIGHSSNPNSFRSKLLKPVEFNPIWRMCLERKISEFKPDIVVHREMFLTDIVLGLKKKHGFQLIADIAEHYPFLIEYWEHYNLILKFFATKFNYYYKLEERLARGSEHLWTVIEENSARLAQYNPNITEIYNSIDPYPLSYQPSDKIRFAYHGFVNKERNLDLFLRAFDRFNKQYPDSELHIHGDGPTLNQLQSASHALRNQNIHVHGRYEFQEMPQLLSQCDVGVIPYPDNEHINHTLSNKFFDYALNCIPILCSDNPPMLRLVNEYQLGHSYHAESEDDLLLKLSEAYRSAKSRPRLDNSAFLAAGYTWSDQKNKMLSTIETLLS